MTIRTDDLLQHDPAPAGAAPIRTDVLIVGAGPVGLFAAFQAGVLGLSCALVEALDEPGGQCIELYPDKPIFDIPALPVCTARELVERLLEQARPFGAPIHLGQRAQTLTRHDDGRFAVRTDTGTVFDAASVLIAGGNGAFMPQRLAVEQAAALEGRSVHYAVRQLDALRGRRVAIAGGGDSALDWALALRDVAASVTLIHRRDTFRAAPATVDALRAAIARDEIALEIGVIDGIETLPPATSGASSAQVPPVADAWPALTALQIKRRDGEARVPADQLIVLYGLVASLGPIGQWGLTITGGRAEVDTNHYQTSLPGVFAAGDIAHYPNKQKLILSGFHEAALALRAAYRIARPDQTRTHIHSSYDPRLAATVLGKPADEGGPRAAAT
ncbi:MAG: NAD(P)/FAD-dependent oxidoreductase [Janthinobacterium lividum]